MSTSHTPAPPLVMWFENRSCASSAIRKNGSSSVVILYPYKIDRLCAPTYLQWSQRVSGRIGGCMQAIRTRYWIVRTSGCAPCSYLATRSSCSEIQRSAP